MLIHLLVIGAIIFLFVSVQWLSRRKQTKQISTSGFQRKQEVAA